MSWLTKCVTGVRSITPNIVTKGTSNFTASALNDGVAEVVKPGVGTFATIKTGLAFCVAAGFGLFIQAETLLAQVVIPPEMAAEGLVESGLAEWADAIAAILVAVVAFALVGVVIRLLTGKKAVRG